MNFLLRKNGKNKLENKNKIIGALNFTKLGLTGSDEIKTKNLGLLYILGVQYFKDAKKYEVPSSKTREDFGFVLIVRKEVEKIFKNVEKSGFQ